MTVNEANVFFPHEEHDDLFDLFEDRFFEYKQFFLAKTPIRKVFESKLDKLMQMNQAFYFLTEQTINNSDVTELKNIEFSDVVLEAFNQWEIEKGNCKKEIMLSDDAYSLRKSVVNYLFIVDKYREKWTTDKEIDLDVPQLSKDEDPMEVLFAIKEFNTQGGKVFNDILKMNSNSFLLKEMKRLSLLSKKY